MRPHPMVKILILDRSPIFRLGLKSFLNAKPEFKVVGEATNGSEAIKMCRQEDYNVILVDIRSLKEENVEGVIREFLLTGHSKVIALSYQENEEEIMRLLKAGCNGLVYKSGDVEQLGLAIEKVIVNQDYYSKDVAEIVFNRLARGNPDIKSLLNVPCFSDRETEIIRLICLQKTAKEIAHELNISEKTVDFHRQKIISKMGVKNIVGLAMYAVKRNIVNIEDINIIT